jgi:hypothetical protein
LNKWKDEFTNNLNNAAAVIHFFDSYAQRNYMEATIAINIIATEHYPLKEKQFREFWKGFLD